MTVAVTDGTAFAGQVFQISVDSGRESSPGVYERSADAGDRR